MQDTREDRPELECTVQTAWFPKDKALQGWKYDILKEKQLKAKEQLQP